MCKYVNFPIHANLEKQKSLEVYREKNFFVHLRFL